MIHQLIDLWFRGWRSLVEILLLSVAIYYGYLYFRGTRGAKVLTGLAIVFLTLTLISTLLNLVVIGWIVRSFSVFLAVALLVIFQPELRRGLAALGARATASAGARVAANKVVKTRSVTRSHRLSRTTTMR